MPDHLPVRIESPALVVAPEDQILGEAVGMVVRSGARHPAVVYLSRLAPGSRRAMEHALATVARALGGPSATILAFPWNALRYQHTAALRAACWDRYAPATTNRILAGVRGVLKEAWRLHLIEAEDYQRAADIRGVRATTLLSGRALTAGEIRSLFLHCAADASPAGVRDAALLGVLYGGGLRRSEAVALDVSDYTAATAELRITRGKGRKARVTYIRGGAASALEAWLTLRNVETGPVSTPLFTRLIKGARVTEQRLTDSGVLHVLQQRARRAGVPPFSPHDVRRTFIGDLLDAGADISTVQRLAGHANVQTTARYDRRGERAKHAAAGLLHVPFAPHAGSTK